MRRLLALAPAALLLSCQGEAGPAPAGSRSASDEVRLAEVRRQLERPFVVFLEPAITIGETAGRVPPPVAVGSQPSPATMASSAPEVVSVEADGSLLPRRPGRAVIRALGGATQLAVTVQPASPVQLLEEPQRGAHSAPSTAARREVSP